VPAIVNVAVEVSSPGLAPGVFSLHYVKIQQRVVQSLGLSGRGGTLEIRIKPFLKGAASVVVPPLRTVHKRNPMSALNAEFCYSIFLRHYSHAVPHFRSSIPEVVAELGPGSSLGVGLCALMFGAKIYYALDFVDHTDPTRNLRVFNALVEMLHERRPVPRHEGTFPEPANWEFPAGFVMPNNDRIQAIRDDLVSETTKFIRVVAPWTSSGVPSENVGWLWSHSVMEHIDEIEQVWKCYAAWLAHDGVMTHNIDYHCHGLAKHWDGHWSINDFCWKVIRGRRPYLLNRLPHSAQMALANNSGFEVVSELIRTLAPGIPDGKFTPRLASSMTPRDRQTGEAFVTLRRAGRNIAKSGDLG
jgi:hypothetical protein